MASGTRYLALLRGINVGGKNLVRMADLRETLEGLGLDGVSTYIASGNVLFRAPRQRRAELAARLETTLTDRFGTELKVVVLTAGQLRAVIDAAPDGFGAETHRCDVIFLRRPLTVKRAFGILDPREGVDEAWTGPGVLYFARLEAEATRSRLGKIVGTPEYRNMTIRSWRTTAKLAQLMDEGE